MPPSSRISVPKILALRTAEHQQYQRHFVRVHARAIHTEKRARAYPHYDTCTHTNQAAARARTNVRSGRNQLLKILVCLFLCRNINKRVIANLYPPLSSVSRSVTIHVHWHSAHMQIPWQGCNTQGVDLLHRAGLEHAERKCMHVDAYVYICMCTQMNPQ